MEGGITISWGVLFVVTLIAVFVLAVAISAATRVGGGHDGPVLPPPPPLWRSEITTTKTTTYKTPRPKAPKPQKVIK